MRLLVILLIVLAGRIDAAELHAILFIDSLAENIESAMDHNYRRWKQNLKKISRFTGLGVKEHIFTGRDLKVEGIRDFFSSLSLGSDDVALFYFCGHGYRTQKKQGPWPYLALAAENVSLDFAEITEILIEKKPRLLISMVDCCNNYIETLTGDLRQEGVVPQHAAVVARNYRKLFLETDGAVIVSSSRPGEFSWAWLHRGSCFTLAFFEALASEVRHPEGTEWAIIFEKAGKKVKDLQTPQYLILPLP